MYILLLCGRRPSECGVRLQGLLDVMPRRANRQRNSKALEVQVVTALCWLNDVTALCTRLTAGASEAGERASKLRGC